MSMFIGEALVGEGNEVAHIDMLIGSKDGPVGQAFAFALANQSKGHSNLLAVLTPNLAVKPATVMITRVTIKGAKQAVQMFGPAQYAVANSRVDALGPEYGGDLQIGDQLLGIPHRTGGATLSVRPLRATTVVFGVAYVGSWTNYDDLAEDDCFSGKSPCFATTRGYWHRYPAFTKANLSITQQITTVVSGFASVTNLTNNEDYEFLNSVPIIGRITVVGVRLRY